MQGPWGMGGGRSPRVPYACRAGLCHEEAARSPPPALPEGWRPQGVRGWRRQGNACVGIVRKVVSLQRYLCGPAAKAITEQWDLDVHEHVDAASGSTPPTLTCSLRTDPRLEDDASEGDYVTRWAGHTASLPSHLVARPGTVSTTTPDGPLPALGSPPPPWPPGLRAGTAFCPWQVPGVSVPLALCQSLCPVHSPEDSLSLKRCPRTACADSLPSGPRLEPQRKSEPLEMRLLALGEPGLTAGLTADRVPLCT